MIQKTLSLLCLLIVGTSLAQKKPITHEDYDLWKSISNTKISDNGKLVVSTVITRTKRDDGYLEIYNTETKQKAVYFNGYNSTISKDEKFVIFQEKVMYKTKRAEKKKKTKKKDQLKDVLYIYDVSSNTL